VATGLALRGLRPVVEIMFGDFLTLCTDQLVNSATKFPLMYRHGVHVPLVVRTPMGGGRGYGPTHSQSLEKLFLGVPGLRVVSPSLAHDPGALVEHAVLSGTSPTLFIEYKNLYARTLLADDAQLRVRLREDAPGMPTAIVDNRDQGALDAVIIGYGGASDAILDLLRAMIPEEIRLRAILPAQLHGDAAIASWLPEVPCDVPILIAEHGTAGFNWGSEVATQLYERLFGRLRYPIRRLASAADVVPAAKHLERAQLFGETMLREALFSALGAT
jgi:acetoin:2,6-dichlorophenolindophenol oxidoreductase subunit beta